MRAQGIKVALLSGDRKHAVESVAGDVGIADYYFDMLPQDKVAWIEDKKQGGAKPGHKRLCHNPKHERKSIKKTSVSILKYK